MTSTLYGWRVSWYTAKARSYLLYHGIPYVEKKPSLWTYKVTIARRCGGDAAVPVVVTPDGEWIQDSSVIIDRLDTGAVASVFPSTPVQRCFSYLVELWADEFWHAAAEHYRFNFPENFPRWRDELATMLPAFLPRAIRHAPLESYRKFMLEATQMLGVVPESVPLVEAWTATQLDALDRHFAAHPFLLGGRATLGDFALMGPINGHLAWDPYPSRQLITPRRHLKAWIARMSRSRDGAGALLPGDAIPEALAPLLGSLFGELVPYLEACATGLHSMNATPRYPRFEGQVDIPFGGGSIRRVVIPYALWMLQRMRDDLANRPAADQDSVRAWLRAQGGEKLLTIEFPRLERHGLHVAPERENSRATA